MALHEGRRNILELTAFTKSAFFPRTHFNYKRKRTEEYRYSTFCIKLKEGCVSGKSSGSVLAKCYYSCGLLFGIDSLKTFMGVLLITFYIASLNVCGGTLHQNIKMSGI